MASLASYIRSFDAGAVALSDPLEPLVRAASRKDPKAIRALLSAIGPAVVAVIEGIFGRGHPEIEDMAQETFVAIVQALQNFRFECTVLHFARRIALRRATMALRHRRAARRSEGATVLRDDLGDVTESDTPSPHSVAVSQRRVELLRQLLADLPIEQAETLALKLIAGFSIDEVAETTGVPASTVRSRLRAAKEALRARILSDERMAELREGREP